jgi:hypothetical protein
MSVEHGVGPDQPRASETTSKEKMGAFMKFVQNDPRFSERAREELIWILSGSERRVKYYQDDKDDSPLRFEPKDYAVAEGNDLITLWPRPELNQGKMNAWSHVMGQQREGKPILMGGFNDEYGFNDDEGIKTIWKEHVNDIRAQWEQARGRQQ